MSDLPLDGSLLHDASHMVGSLKAALARANYLENRVLNKDAVFVTFTSTVRSLESGKDSWDTLI